MHKLALTVVLLAFATGLSASAFAQGKAAQAPTPSQAVRESWNEIGRKLIAMAEDFPEDKYDFKPVPEQRSFAEQLLHVAGSNDYFIDVAQGKKPTDDENRAHYSTKAAVVGYLKKSFASGASLIQAKGDQGMTTVGKDESGKPVL